MKNQPSYLIQRLAAACAISLAVAACSKTAEAPPPPPPAASMPAPPPTTVGTDIDDGVVTTRVKSALLADPDIKSFEIKVETRKGQVQLSGFIDTQAHIDSAVAMTSKIEGVKGVENGMTLKDGKETVGNTVDDSIVTTKVKSAFLADSAVKSSDIAVVTRKGVVQLSGFVDSQAQMDRAIEVARAVDGAKSIGNEMTIKK